MKADKVISDIASALGIIGFLGSIASAIFGETVAVVVLVSLTVLSWLVWLTVRVVVLSSKVQKLSGGVSASEEKTTSAVHHIEKHLEHAPLIASTDQKHEKINSNFLNYEECTVLINILVSKENTGIRNPKPYKYILGHRENLGDKEINRFGLRYAETKRWELLFSDTVDECCISRSDGLQPGWHQFMISWDKSKPQLEFLIDQGSTEASSTFLEYWPNHLAETVCVGAWKSSDLDSFVETRVADLWVIDRHLKATDAVVAEHRKLRAST